MVSLSDYVIKVRGFAADSPAGFAARIVCAHLDWHWAREFGDIDRVSDTAHDLSTVILMEQMKREWDVPAMQGKSTLKTLDRGRSNGRDKRTEQARAAAKEMRKLDAKICRTPKGLKPTLSKRVAYIQPKITKPNGKPYGKKHIENVLTGRWPPRDQK